MASGPGEAAIGVGGLGLGVLLIFAAYKNAPVLGSDGLLTQAITKGTLSAPNPRAKTPSKPDNSKKPGPTIVEDNFQGGWGAVTST